MNVDLNELSDFILNPSNRWYLIVFHRQLFKGKLFFAQSKIRFVNKFYRFSMISRARDF
jgi:hypothetical protein